MILNKKPLTLAEVKALISNIEDRKELNDYMKAFSKLPEKEAKELSSEIHGLNNPKLNDEKIVKIVDLLPKDTEDLGKILNDVSLSEDESNAILNITKNY